MPTARLSNDRPVFYGLRFGAIHKFNNSHWRVVTRAIADFQDSRIASWALGIARAKIGEQLTYCGLVAQAIERQTTLRYAVVFTECDQRLNNSCLLYTSDAADK